MQTGYRAICDKCGKAIEVLNTSTFHLLPLPEDQSKLVKEFLEAHHGCELRLVQRDDQLDKLWEEGWAPVNGWAQPGYDHGRLERKHQPEHA